MLESLRPNPAYVISRTMDILAGNAGSVRLFAGTEDWPAERRNALRYLFLDPHAPKLFADWDEQVRTWVGRIRAPAGTETGHPRPGPAHRRTHSGEPGVRAPLDGLRRAAAPARREDVPPPGGRRPRPRPPVMRSPPRRSRADGLISQLCAAQRPFGIRNLTARGSPRAGLLSWSVKQKRDPDVAAHHEYLHRGASCRGSIWLGSNCRG